MMGLDSLRSLLDQDGLKCHLRFLKETKVFTCLHNWPTRFRSHIARLHQFHLTKPTHGISGSERTDIIRLNRSQKEVEVLQ